MMNWLQSILYGMISGFATFLPVSSGAHEMIMQRLFGTSPQPLHEFVIHLAVFLALLFSCGGQLRRIARERKLLRAPARRRKRRPDERAIFDWRLLKTAGLIAILLNLLQFDTRTRFTGLSMTAVFLLFNGMILYIPRHLPSGNKSSLSASNLDGWLLGITSSLGMIPGLSGLAASTTVAAARGFDREYAVNICLLAAVPVMAVTLAFDLAALVTAAGLALGWKLMLQVFLSAAAAFAGGYFAIVSMRFLAVKTGYHGFAFYCWGGAMFAFILYMLI